MPALHDAIKTYLAMTGESMASLSRRAGLSPKAVANILTRDGSRPRQATIDALSAAMGRELPGVAAAAPITFAQLIKRIPEKAADKVKADRLVQRMRWLLRVAKRVAEVERVDRADVQAFLARSNPASFGLSPGSFATYKAEVMAALDLALPRARPRGISDISGIYSDVHRAITESALPQDLQLISGSFLVYLHDQGIRPADITQSTLQRYYLQRMEVSPRGEEVARRHVRRIAALLERLTAPAFARFQFAAPGHPFGDGRDRYGVPDATIGALMQEFDAKVAPWAMGRCSREGQPLDEFIEWLDTQAPSAADQKRALLRRGGLRSRDKTGGQAREASLSAHGFLLPRNQWSEATLQCRRGYVAAGAKALFARTGFLVETVEELTDPEIAWSLATALADANPSEFQSGYAASVMKMIVKVAADFVCRPEADMIELRKSAAALESSRGMAERNIAKLRRFTPERIEGFLCVSDRILEDVNARSDRRRKASGESRKAMRLDIEQCRDIMCALAHDIMLVRAPRSANLLGIRLDWIRWSGERATIVVPSASVKMRSTRDPDLPLDLTADTSRLLRQYLDKVRPLALSAGDEANPYLFPGQSTTPGEPFGNLLNRLARWVFKLTGAEIHPHLYRHMIGWIWLRQDIGMLPVVQQLLGHQSLQTTINYYAAIDEALAMQEWQEFLNASRAKR